ncbi:MAG: histidine kinase [Thermoanaerobaculia bacterium]|nr:histidine kinase [Thermoanaerobaculia bacterium]
MTPEAKRPSADEFLQLIERAKRGRLKIYFGHAAGVGKTYQMLEDAHALKEQGVDVVAGLIETHGRAETAEMADGLEMVPRRRIEYKGRILEEMDLDAIIERHPALVLVDELAHTNVPGSRNEKRYQDVEDILKEGISVMTTVNVQHFESVQEVVSRVTGIEVRERIPDRFLAHADAVINVDLPSEELIQRLRDGKIYPAERIEAALSNFFKEENLASLRELALRCTADQLEAARRPKLGGGEPEPVGTKLMVAMSSNPDTTRLLLRKGSAVAGRLNTNWFAVYVRTPAESPQRMTATQHRLLMDNVVLAMELGAKVIWLTGTDPRRELLRFARENGVTMALFGKVRRPIWQRLLKGDPMSLIARLGTGIDVLEVETEES